MRIRPIVFCLGLAMAPGLALPPRAKERRGRRSLCVPSGHFPRQQRRRVKKGAVAAGRADDLQP
jgi:hypothetical protein